MGEQIASRPMGRWWKNGGWSPEPAVVPDPDPNLELLRVLQVEQIQVASLWVLWLYPG